jgi:hypothetical protein
VSAQSKYLSGLYLEASESSLTARNKAYVLGGLVFTGQHQKARLLYKEIYKSLNSEEKMIANFHMGVSHVRTSEYQTANTYFIGNLLALRQKKHKPLGAFFTYQGLGFYRYFFSQHNKSQKWANLGYAQLLKDKNSPPLLLALSLDIQGHNLIQLGRIHAGLAMLNKAHSICKKNKLKSLESEIEVSIYVYQSEFDDRPKVQIEKLKNLYKKNESKNDYSHSALVLQVAKLYITLGQFNLANDFVTANYDVIYKNENKRNIAILNTLISQLLYKKGQFLEALSVAKIARRNLDELIDISLIIPILALEIKILKYMKKDDSDLRKYTDKLSKKTDRHLNLKIYNRVKNINTPSLIGEDKLGDLVDRLHAHDVTALEFIFEHEILGLLTSYFKISPGTKTLMVLEDKKHLILFDLDGISQNTKLTRTQILFLKNLNAKGTTKQTLIENVWGYEYDPLRHDSLIYTTVARLKKIFGAKKNWIISEETQYLIRDDVQLVFKTIKDFKVLPTIDVSSAPKNFINTISKHETKLNPITLDQSLSKKTSSLKQVSFEQGLLNYRQIETLADPPDSPMCVSEYAKLWKVTRMTSLRDLKLLCDQGLAIKSGRGRATRYHFQT